MFPGFLPLRSRILNPEIEPLMGVYVGFNLQFSVRERNDDKLVDARGWGGR